VDKPVELVPLLCVNCSAPIQAGTDEIAWACENCGQGQILDEGQGLIPLEILFSAKIPAGNVGRPFWVTGGIVSLDREVFGVFGKQTGEADRFWGQPRQFFIPAFSCSLESLISTGKRLLADPPTLQSGPPVRFEPVTLHKEDVVSAVEFIIVGIEAGRKDKIKKVDYSIDLSEPVLWILE
jgi:hypothetical protein